MQSLVENLRTGENALDVRLREGKKVSLCYKKTFDVYLWQTIENKQKFISQMMTSKTLVRVAEDVDGSFLNYTEIKVLRLAELNKLLDMGEVEEKRNDNPLVKRAIIDFCNREYEEHHSYDEFDVLYPDLKHIGIAYTNTPDEKHEIQYELNLEDYTWTQYIDDIPIKIESFDYENKGENEALRNMKNEIEISSDKN